MKHIEKRWLDQTVCCIASGPSLTAEDCATVEASGVKTIAVNNSWELARFAHVIYAGDQAWWNKHRNRISIPADLWTCNVHAAKRYEINLHPALGGYNSGLRAIELAAAFGSKRIILLGYDCMITDGKTHFHGNHPNLSNPDRNRIKIWQAQFSRLPRQMRDVTIVNASRQTALKCFKIAPLQEALNG